MMPGVNYVIYGCFSARTSPRVSLYWTDTKEKHYCSYYSRQADRWKFEKANFKNRIFVYL